MWRARLWIPYCSMPIGLGLLTLQYVADLIKLVTGREPPFGLAEATPRMRGQARMPRRRAMSPTTQGAIVLIVTLVDAAVRRAGGVRPRRDLDRRSS